MLPTDPLFWLFASLAVICFGLAKGGFAGMGIAGTPLLALAAPPLQAAAILLPILLMQDAISLWAFRREWNARVLKIMLPGAVVGIALGWALAAHVPDAWIKLIIGIIAVLFVLSRWFDLANRAAEEIKPSVPGGVIWGAVSGFTSMLAHAGSPPYNIHVLPQRLPKMVYIGTFTIFFAAVNAIKVAPFALLGQFTKPVLLISLLLIPLAILSNLSGIWLIKRVSEKLFYRIAYGMTFIVGIELIRQGAVTIFWR
jgi:uncharacterized membrane protein YfcA